MPPPDDEVEPQSSAYVPVRVLRARLAELDDPVLRAKIDAAVAMTRRALDLYR
jgi:hypothetical protein